MASKKVCNVELVLVDAETLGQAMRDVGLEPSGIVADDVRAYAAHVKANVPKDRIGECDECGGDSDTTLPVCPFCGIGGVDLGDGAAPAPGFEPLAAPKAAPKTAPLAAPKGKSKQKIDAPAVEVPPAEVVEVPPQTMSPVTTTGKGRGRGKKASSEVAIVHSEGPVAAKSEQMPVAALQAPQEAPVEPPKVKGRGKGELAQEPPQEPPQEPSQGELVLQPAEDESHAVVEDAIPVGEAVPGLTINDAIGKVHAAKAAAVCSYWDLGASILDCYRGDLWKQARDDGGQPLYRSFKSFCEAALDITPMYAYRLMKVANSYTRADVERVGVAKLSLMLRLPSPERQEMLEAVRAGNVPVREIVAKVREKAAGLPAQAGVGKRGPLGGADAHGRKGKQSEPPAPAVTKKGSKEAFTLTISRRIKVPLFATKDYSKPELRKRAKRLADNPVAEFETLNGQTIKVVLTQDAQGQLLAVLEVKR